MILNIGVKGDSTWFPELNSKAVVSGLKWALKTELIASERAASALSQQTIFQPPTLQLELFSIVSCLESNSGCLPERNILLTTEPSFQPQEESVSLRCLFSGRRVETTCCSCRGLRSIPSTYMEADNPL